MKLIFICFFVWISKLHFPRFQAWDGIQPGMYTDVGIINVAPMTKYGGRMGKEGGSTRFGVTVAASTKWLVAHLCFPGPVGW